MPPSHRLRPSLCLIPAFLVLLGALPAQGEDGFLRGRGHLDVALSFAYEEFDHFWVGDDRVSAPGVGTVSRYSWNLWAAYGITDDLDVSAAASWVDADSSGPLDDREDFQDLTLKLKWRFGRWRIGPGELSLLAVPGVKVPLGHYQEDFLTAIGDEQVDLQARIVAHYAFDAGVWMALETGYDFRFESTPNEIPLNFKVGCNLFDVANISAFYTSVHSNGGYDIMEGPFPGLEEEYHRIGASVFVPLNDTFGLSATAFTTIDGRNTGDTSGFSVGAVLSF